MCEKLKQLIGDQNQESDSLNNKPNISDKERGKQVKARLSIDMNEINSNFTIVNKEVIDPESYDINSEILPEAKFYPGTNWKWNQFNMKRLMMSDVKEHVQKMVDESKTKNTRELRQKQNSLVRRLFKKRAIKYEDAINMSNKSAKKKKLARVANAIIIAARKMKEHNITLDELMSGQKKI